MEQPECCSYGCQLDEKKNNFELISGDGVSKTVRCHVKFRTGNSCDDKQAVLDTDISLDNVREVEREDVLHEKTLCPGEDITLRAQVLGRSRPTDAILLP